MWCRRLQRSRFLAAVVATAASSSTRTQTAAFTSPAFHRLQSCSRPHQIDIRNNNLTQQKMSFSVGDEPLQRINKEAMTEIIEDVANSSREEAGYVIIDVRGQDEIGYTGKLDDVVETLPLPYIAEGALTMDEDDFKDKFGFDKPSLDETIVFSCAAGIRSVHAAKFAQMAGYTNIVDYMGGAHEWFS